MRTMLRIVLASVLMAQIVQAESFSDQALAPRAKAFVKVMVRPGIFKYSLYAILARHFIVTPLWGQQVDVFNDHVHLMFIWHTMREFGHPDEIVLACYVIGAVAVSFLLKSVLWSKSKRPLTIEERLNRLDRKISMRAYAMGA